MKEITIEEVAEQIGVSSETIRINYKKYSSRIEALGITKEGKGRKAKFFINDTSNSDEYKLAYDTFICIFRDAFHFDTQTNFDNLLLLVGYILSYTTDKEHYFTIKEFSFITKINDKTIRRYVSKLRDLKILKYKDVSRKYYIATQRVYDDNGNVGIFSTDITELMQIEGIEEAWNGINIPKRYRNIALMKEIHVQILRDLEKYSVYNIYKLEFTPSVLADTILKDIIYNAYCYKLMNDNKFLSLSLKLENIEKYIQEIRSF